MKTIPKVPRHAETTFASLCAADGVTCNPAVEDERGWDFFLQFPRRTVPGLPLDMTAPGEQCFVQIKTNSGKTRGVTLKASNALEFSSSDSPCFVVLFTYDITKSRIENVYLLHFWEPEIARTLKKIREADSSGRSDLHRINLRFALRDMETASTDNLVSKILLRIRNHGPNYSEEKRRIARSVGFEKTALSGTIVFREGVSIKDIVDVQLGLRDSLEIAHFSARSTRFGIPALTPVLRFDAGQVSMRSHPIRCDLTVSSELAGREVKFQCQLLKPNVPGIPPPEMRFRVTSPFINLICSLHNASVDFTAQWNGQERYCIRDIAIVLDLLHIFSSGRARFILEIDGNRIFGAAGPTESFSVDTVLETIDKFVRFLIANLRSQETPKQFSMSLSDLGDRIQRLAEHNVLVGDERIEGQCEIEWHAAPYMGEALALYYIPVEFEGFTIYTTVRRVSKMHAAVNGKIGLLLGTIDYTNIQILPGSQTETEPAVAADFNSRILDYKDVPMLAIGNIMNVRKPVQ